MWGQKSIQGCSLQQCYAQTDTPIFGWKPASKNIVLSPPFIFWAIDFVQKRFESIYRHKYKVLLAFQKEETPSQSGEDDA